MRTLDMTTRSEGFSGTSLIVIRYNQMKVLQNPDSFEISDAKTTQFMSTSEPTKLPEPSKGLLQLSRIAFDLRKLTRLKIRLRNGSQPFFSPVHATPELNLSLTLQIKLTL